MDKKYLKQLIKEDIEKYTDKYEGDKLEAAFINICEVIGAASFFGEPPYKDTIFLLHTLYYEVLRENYPQDFLNVQSEYLSLMERMEEPV